MTGLELLTVNSAGQARQVAIEWQNNLEDRSYSYDELMQWQAYFTKLGERFGLLDEFQENGVL